MAKIKGNALVKGFSGSIDGLTFRQLKGETIITRKRILRKKTTPNQKASQETFRNAVCDAKLMMLDPEKKKYYSEVAKQRFLTNGFTAALQDCLAGYHGTVLTEKRKKTSETNTGNLKVVLRDSGGKIIEEGIASKRYGEWLFQLSKDKSWITIETL